MRAGWQSSGPASLRRAPLSPGHSSISSSSNYQHQNNAERFSFGPCHLSDAEGTVM